MPKGRIGFEQLNENLQQKIQLGGSGSGGGVGFLKNTVKITANTNTVRIGLYFKAGTDALLVFKNSTYQELNHDYIIDKSGKYIKTISDQWIASEESPVTFNFIVLRTVPLANSITANTTSVGFIRKTILVDQDTNELELDLMYNKTTDAILVFKNSVLIEAEEDYTIDMDRQVLINPNSNWVAGTVLNLMVFKSVPMEDVRFDGSIIADGSISIDKLSPEFNLLINNLVRDFQTSIAQLNDDINYQTAGGTGTAITLRLGTLKQGYNKTFIAIANNNGVATTVNGKPLYKPNTKIAPTLISGKAYTIWYDEKGNCFFFKASAEGDALSENVLATKKFSNDHDTGIIGTMPNNGTITGALNCGESKKIPKGYTDGGTIIANSLASQTQANAVASDILISKNAWVNGSKINGTMPNNGAINATLNCGQSKIIPAGYTSGGTITANSLASQTNATAVASDILSGKTAWVNGNKITGNMNDLRSNNVYCGAEGVASLNVYAGNSGYGQLKITPSPIQKPHGYADHTTTFETHLLNLLPQNIKANVSIAGKMTGTFTSDANATAGDMISGKTAYVKGSKITGSIPNRGEYQYAGHLGSGIDYLAFANIPYGYYPSSGNGWAPEIRAKFSDVASHLGITPDKLIAGTSACGVHGTAASRKDAFADLSSLFRFNEHTTKPQIDYVLSQIKVNVWNRLSASMSLHYSGFDGAITRNRYYTLGGEDRNNSVTSVVRCFDMATETFSYSNDLPRETAYTTVAKTPVGIFLLGVYKYNSRGDSLYDNYCYQWNANDTFSSIPNIPQIYDNVGLVDSGSKLYVTGGVKFGGGSSNYWYYYQTLYAFDYTTRTWTTLINEGYMRDDKNVIDRGDAAYYYNNKLYDKYGRCQVDLSTNKWDAGTLASIPNVAIPSTFLPVRTATMVNDDKKEFYKSGNNILIKDYNTGSITAQSKFSGETQAESLKGLLGNNNFIYAIDRVRDSSKSYYLNVLKLDRNFDNYLAT